jgi:hypothetical protein
MKYVLLIIILFFHSLSFAADVEDKTKREIQHLFKYLAKSNCEFNRNGVWYGPEEARKHIEKKYRYLNKLGLINSAEQFIDRAASKSSMSGKSYLVRCGESTVPSSTWFSNELKRFKDAYHD